MFREHSGRTNDMDTIEYATFSCDTVKVENGLKCRKQFQYNFSKLFPFLKGCIKKQVIGWVKN